MGLNKWDFSKKNHTHKKQNRDLKVGNSSWRGYLLLVGEGR